MKSIRRLLLVCIVTLTWFPCYGLLFYGLDNNATTTDPGIGFDFAGVGRLESAGGSVYGSAVHLGRGYMLTASHVFDQAGATSGLLRFESGGSTHSIVPGSIQSVATGVDLRVFRVSGVSPYVPWIKLYEGTNDAAPAVSYMTGWGYGRDGTPLNSQQVNWSNTTSDKRWGANVVRGANLGGGPSYDNLYTVLEPSSDGAAISPYSYETALTDKDSGSALFLEEGGEWYLTGIATSIAGQTGRPAGSNVVFGSDTYGGDINLFVRISSYADDIIVVIPEVSSLALMGILLGTGWVFGWRRRP